MSSTQPERTWKLSTLTGSAKTRTHCSPRKPMEARLCGSGRKPSATLRGAREAPKTRAPGNGMNYTTAAQTVGQTAALSASRSGPLSQPPQRASSPTSNAKWSQLLGMPFPVGCEQLLPVSSADQVVANAWPSYNLPADIEGHGRSVRRGLFTHARAIRAKHHGRLKLRPWTMPARFCAGQFAAFLPPTRSLYWRLRAIHAQTTSSSLGTTCTWSHTCAG